MKKRWCNTSMAWKSLGSTDAFSRHSLDIPGIVICMLHDLIAVLNRSHNRFLGQKFKSLSSPEKTTAEYRI